MKQKLFALLVTCAITIQVHGMDESSSSAHITISSLHECLSHVIEDPLCYSVNIGAATTPIWTRHFKVKTNGAPIAYDEFNRVAGLFVRVIRNEIADSRSWLDGVVNHAHIRKELLARDASVAVFGDIHGSAHSLLRSLLLLNDMGVLNNDFVITDPKFCMIFLGDYIDRGPFSTETLYAVMRLKIANPTQVMLLAGNHELGVRGFCSWQDELKNRYGEEIGCELELLLQMAFMQLPRALYQGVTDENGITDYVLYAHAAIDPLHNVHRFLAADSAIKFCAPECLPATTFAEEIKARLTGLLHVVIATRLVESDAEEVKTALTKTLEKVIDNVFGACVWHYFTDKDVPIAVERDLIPRYGMCLVKRWLDEISHDPVHVHCIIRGHQHGDEQWGALLDRGNGYCAQGDNSVHTIVSSAGAGGICLPFDSFLFIKTAGAYAAWRCSHFSRMVGFTRKEVKDFNWRAATGKKKLELGETAFTEATKDSKRFKELVVSMHVPIMLRSSHEVLTHVPWQETAISLAPGLGCV